MREVTVCTCPPKRAVKKKEEEISQLKTELDTLQSLVDQERTTKEQQMAKAAQEVDVSIQEKEETEAKLRTTARTLDECQRKLEASGEAFAQLYHAAPEVYMQRGERRRGLAKIMMMMMMMMDAAWQG